VTAEFGVGDVVRLSKKHPCGSYEWVVMRVGADVGIKCRTCGRRVTLERGEFEKRLRQVVARWQDAFGPKNRLSLEEEG